MEESEYQDILEEAEDELDDSEDIREEQLDSYAVGTYPQAKEQQSIYNWFWKVVGLEEPLRVVKVGNLTTQEIGMHNVSVRDSLNLAHLGNVFHHKKFAAYFQALAQITAVTSMSKRGWFMDLSISQKRVRERSKSPSAEAWRVFNKKKGKTQTED